MNDFDKVLRGIRRVLDARTSYEVSKALGVPNRTINRYQNGTTPIENMTLGTALKIYQYYELEMKEMEEVKEMIAKVESLEIGLADTDPDYHEREYIDGAADHYIVHPVEGTDIKVFFAEHEHVRELRKEIYDGTKTDDDFMDLQINELADQYDYDKVVAYRVDGGPIEWL